MKINLKNKLKKTIALSGVILAFGMAAPAFAQYGPGPGYDGPGYYGGPGEAGWGAYDNGRTWRGARWWHQHQIMWFYRHHPEWAVMDSQWLNEDGDYDNDNNWHDAYWWHQNNPDFFYANHPNWISWEPNWRDQDGAYDGQHNWHYGQWWYNQNPNWVSTIIRTGSASIATGRIILRSRTIGPRCGPRTRATGALANRLRFSPTG